MKLLISGNELIWFRHNGTLSAEMDQYKYELVKQFTVAHESIRTLYYKEILLNCVSRILIRVCVHVEHNSGIYRAFFLCTGNFFKKVKSSLEDFDVSLFFECNFPCNFFATER